MWVTTTHWRRCELLQHIERGVSYYNPLKEVWVTTTHWRRYELLQPIEGGVSYYNTLKEVWVTTTHWRRWRCLLAEYEQWLPISASQSFFCCSFVSINTLAEWLKGSLGLIPELLGKRLSPIQFEFVAKFFLSPCVILSLCVPCPFQKQNKTKQNKTKQTNKQKNPKWKYKWYFQEW